MDIEIKCFRSYQFDGNIYVQCPALRGKSTSIHYSLRVDGKLVSEQVAAGSGQICFEGLKPAVYTVSAQTLPVEGEPACAALVTINIPESAPNKNLAASLATLPALSERLERDSRLNEYFQYCSSHTENSKPPSLKGRLSLNEGNKNILYVMFETGGYDRLLTDVRFAKAEMGHLNNLKLKRVFDSTTLANKRGKLRQLDSLTNLYHVTNSVSEPELLTIAQALEALEYVRYCSIEIDTTDLPPPQLPIKIDLPVGSHSADEDTPTPDFLDQQRYLEDNAGMDVYQAWEKFAETGKSATVRHLDFGVYSNHEDLIGNITVVNSRPETSDCNHGTAATGCIAAKSNEFGVTGIAHECEFYFYDTGDTPRVIEDMGVGDILSFNIQVSGTPLLPHLHLKGIWDLYYHAVAAGAVVIYAAGNGASDISNTPSFNDWGDCGALLVGAVSSSLGTRIWFSNYNLYRAINSWGEKVATTGYSGLQDYEGHDRDYTPTFNGTSSATPLASGALALIQSYAISKYNVCFTASEMHLLVQTWGSSDATGQLIGHRPWVANILSAVDIVLTE